MALTPKSAYGTELKRGDGTTSETFTEIEGVRNGPNGPQESLDLIDTTSHSSAAAYREVVPSFINPGEVTFDLIFDSTNAQHTGLITDLTSRVQRNFQQVRTDAGAEQLAYAAYVTNLAGQNPIDDAVTMACTIGVDGAITRS